MKKQLTQMHWIENVMIAIKNHQENSPDINKHASNIQTAEILQEKHIYTDIDFSIIH